MFLEIAERKEQTKTPMVELFRHHWKLVVVAALVFAGNSAVGYMTTGGYIQNYATNPDGPVGLDRGPVLWAVAGSALSWMIFTWLGAWVSDRIGRRTTYLVGWVLLLAALVPLFTLVDVGNIWVLLIGLVSLTVGLGFTYGPQAALYAELFPASVRFSGVSISYAIGAIIGGAFAPMIAAALVRSTGSAAAVTVYLVVVVLVSATATLLLRDRSCIPLGPDNEQEQSISPIRGLAKV